jgi:xylan 1,4-beta-xylosidase
VLGAFKLLGRLQGARLPVTSSGAAPLDELLSNGVRQAPDVDAMATLNGNTIQILVWNYHDDLVATAAAPVRLTTRLPATFGTHARVAHLRVDDTHGNAFAAWSAQGRPTSPTSEQRASLLRAMAPSLLVPEKIVDTDSLGAVTMDFEIPRFGVSLITLSPSPAPSEGCTCGAARVTVRPLQTLLFALGVSLFCALRHRKTAGRTSKSRLINRSKVS